MSHSFISYSRADADSFAFKLLNDLKAGAPPVAAWLDQNELQPGIHWDDQIVEAIRSCACLLFVMTRDSVESTSVCKNEWTRAIKYKKPVVPLLVHADAEVPFQLENRQYIDFSSDYDDALVKLREHLAWRNSPEGKLQSLKDRLMDSQRDARRTFDAAQKARIESDIEALKQQIADQELIVKNPRRAAERLERSVTAAIERERRPRKPASGTSTTKFVYYPPGIAPLYFQNRHLETRLIGRFLANDVERVMTIVGRGGIGKTAMVCRLLKALEAGRLPDDGEALSVDGIVYLSERGTHKVRFLDLFTGLCQLLPREVAEDMDKHYRDPMMRPADQMRALLEAFPGGRHIVLLDNFEDKVDPRSTRILDDELREVLEAFLKAPPHGVKIIVTTRIAPKALALVNPSLQTTLVLDEGLESPFAENILREMDKDGKLGLRGAPAALLDEARRRTNGYPRALEALFAILSSDRATSLEDLLKDVEQLLPEHVVETMVGEAYSRLDPDAQKVMQALAIYGRPVPKVAIDFMLQPHLIGLDVARILSRLVNMQFIRREGSNYFLHPVDREYALARIPRGEPADKHLDEDVFSQYALLNRGARYFTEVRMDREAWQNIDDLAAQLAEFDLRVEAEDYDNAAEVLLQIDHEYLMFWGHYALTAALHEKLQGRLTEPVLQSGSTGNLATAYSEIGDYMKAIHYYEVALEIVRTQKDREGESTWLGNLGSCYIILGDTHRAIDYQSQALAITRDIGDRFREGIWLGNLGVCYFNLGETDTAHTHYEEALAIARELDDVLGEATTLNNLGAVSASIDAFEEAESLLRDAIRLADELGFNQIQNEGRHDLALTLLYKKDYSGAAKIVQEALHYDYPPNNHQTHTLQGVISSCLGRTDEAVDAFARAIEATDVLLNVSRKNVTALHIRGVSLCGLALCKMEEAHVQSAIEAFEEGLTVNQDRGTIQRVLRLLDTLVDLDEDEHLLRARKVFEA